MTSTFRVYPRNSFTPTIGALLDLGQARLQEQLERRGIWRPLPRLQIHLCDGETRVSRPLAPHEALAFDTGKLRYLWLSLDGLDGGMDICSVQMDRATLAWHAERIRTAYLAEGMYWNFRISAGQPCAVAFAGGILAATLAEMTDGLLDSEDGAWEIQRFPASAQAFYSWYFDPEQVLDASMALWAKRAMQELRRPSR